MEIVGKLNKLKNFLEDKVCNEMKIKAPSKTDNYILTTPKIEIMEYPLDTNNRIKYPFICITLSEIIDDGKIEVIDISLEVFVFNNGKNIIDELGERTFHPNKGDGWISLFNFLSKIKRELIANSKFLGLLQGTEIKITIGEEDFYPYYPGIISFKMVSTAYPRPLDKEMSELLNM